ncbi:MAG: outer membrane protein [Pseudomonadota bacterium]
MKRFGQLTLAVSAMAIMSQANAADMMVPQVIEAPVMAAPEVHHKASGNGWYLRGDVGYSFNNIKDIDYITQGIGRNGRSSLDGDLDDSYVIGVGVGAHINKFLRADVTLDYLTEADFHGSTSGFCTGLGPDGVAGPNPALGGVNDDVAGAACSSSDKTSFSAVTLMANAYVDLGTYGRVTPYVGVGIGGAHVSFDHLENTIPAGFIQSGTVKHGGSEEWRFAYALHAGASIDVTCNAAIDVGYKYQKIEGGEMFQYAEADFGAGPIGAGGPGFDDGIESHQIRAGLRYKFGKNDCAPKLVHTPVHQPVYK